MTENDTRSLLEGELVVINIGLELFASTLHEQGVTVAQVEWSPPAQGDPDLANILDQLL